MKYEFMTAEMPKDMCMHKILTAYKYKYSLPEWYNFYAPCILSNIKDYYKTDMNYPEESALKNRSFKRDVILNVRIVATNNSQLPLNDRTTALYYVEKDYAGFSAQWIEVKTEYGRSILNFNNVQPGERKITEQCFKLKLPLKGSFYVIAQINDINNTLNPRPNSTTQVDIKELDKSYLWSVIDVDNTYYLTC